MRVLVTGHRGHIGRHVVRALTAAGHDVMGFDLVDGDDVLDPEAVADALAGCNAVVHLALVDGGDLVTMNLEATWNVLSAAGDLDRAVITSSVRALGCFAGAGLPAYLPIDDAHPASPSQPYDVLKLRTEVLARDALVETVCIRPPHVLDDDGIAWVRRRRAADEAAEWTPFWEYGAWIHAEDLADAIERALVCDLPEEHVVVTVAADDVSSDQVPGRELAERLLPDVEWRGGPEFDADPWRSLVACRSGRDVLGWSPRRRWAER